ncbi:MAG TPA: archaellin/type IV pilin N-terminal domain-containing protein, partial [Acidimicrobiales bacterium]|nr:archaellin/type IV pilin N-terminal domain-containing protein [Acidimicrobiales bacterium]
MQVSPHTTCSTTAGFQFTVTGGWHSALSGVLASIVFVAIVFVLTNAPPSEHHRHERGPSLRILFVTFFVFLVASFLWATVAGFPTRSTEGPASVAVPVAVQPVLAVPAA